MLCCAVLVYRLGGVEHGQSGLAGLLATGQSSWLSRIELRGARIGGVAWPSVAWRGVAWRGLATSLVVGNERHDARVK